MNNTTVSVLEWIPIGLSLPEEKEKVLLDVRYPNPEYNTITVGYLLRNDQRERDIIFRDLLCDANAFDDSYNPSRICVEAVFAWARFKK